MAERLPKPNIVDIMSCELIGEMHLDVQSTITSNHDLRNMHPIRFSVYVMKSEIYLQINLEHKAENDMVEASLEVLSPGSVKNLRFKIQYGIRSYLEFRLNPQIFLYTEANTKSTNYPVCKLADLIDFMVDNDTSLGLNQVDFISAITISLRDTEAPLSKYSIPTVNAKDADHKLVCDGHEISIHKHIVMAASKYFRRRFLEYPQFNSTVINRLEESKRIKLDVLTCLLRFMYGLYIYPQNLLTANLLSAAREFEVTKLFEICQERLIKDLSPGKAPELLYIGISEKASKLRVAAAKFILSNYRAITSRYEWAAIQEVFPEVFGDIKRNPLKYLREIVHPDVRSKSTGDLITDCSVWFKQTSPSFRIPPLSGDNKDTKDTRGGKNRPKGPSTDSSSVDVLRRGSDSTLMDVESLSLDVVVPRERASPVINRRCRSVSLSIGAYDLKPLARTLPMPKFSRETLKKKLLANEPKFDDSFGPTDASPTSSRTSLSRTLSTPEEYRSRSFSAELERSDRDEHFDFKLQYYKPDFTVPMDCGDDSNMDETPTLETPAVPQGNQGNRPDVSSDDLFYPSLAFTYSYSSDSVFERKSPNPKAPTPAEPMSVSEISSQDIVSPRAMKRIDFQRYAHPEARSLSDVSSLPRDPSSSEQPLSTPSSRSKSKSKRAKRMQKKAEKSRKYYPPPPSKAIFDFSSTKSTSSTPTMPSTDEPTGLIPRPTFSKAKSPKEKQQSPSQLHQKRFIQKSPIIACPEITESEMPPRKIKFGGSESIPKFEESEEIAESEQMQMKYYENWLDTAVNFNIQDVFQEVSSSYAERLDVNPGASGEIRFYEKNIDELERKLHKNVSDESEPSTSEYRETGNLKRKISSRDSAPEYKTLEKRSPTSSSASAAEQFPIGGGVIRKAPGRFKMPSVDEPAPLSSTESIATTTSGLSSSEEINFKKLSPSSPTSIQRTKSFVDLRTIRHPLLTQKKTSTSVFSFGSQEAMSQQQMEQSVTQRREEEDIEDEKQTYGATPKRKSEDQ